MEEPERLQRRPHQRGLPVPFVALQREDGSYDFRVVDMVRWKAAVERWLCALCGEALDYWIVFIGGPLTCEARIFFDPGMHEACARFALEACPFLTGRQEYAPVEKVKAMNREATIYADPMIPSGKNLIGLYFTRKYSIIPPNRVHAAPAKRIEWIERPALRGGEQGVALHAGQDSVQGS